MEEYAEGEFAQMHLCTCARDINLHILICIMIVQFEINNKSPVFASKLITTH